MMIEDFTEQVRKLFLEWEAIYRQEIRNYDYCLPGWDCLDPDFQHEERANLIEQLESMLEIQIDFIRRYIASVMLDGDTDENLSRIRKFLSYQHLDENNLPEGRVPALTLVFWGGNIGNVVSVNIEELNEFDFADSWADIEFDILCIRDNKLSKWGQERIDRSLENVKDDFEFDGYEMDIRLINEGHVNSTDEVCFECHHKNTQ